MNQKHNTLFTILFITILIIAIIGLFWAIPQYNIYSLEMSGKAKLAEAEWSKKITIEEAKAEKTSAILKAEAEIERAKGIAEANKIIAKSITQEYIQYKFIEGLNDGNTEVIYVPTESNLPILEANRQIK